MKDEKLYLIHIAECVQRIESYTQDGRDAFMQSPKTQDAVIRNFEVMGEGANAWTSMRSGTLWSVICRTSSGRSWRFSKGLVEEGSGEGRT